MMKRILIALLVIFERYAEKGADICLLEYTRDKRLISEIRDYCQKHGFKYYISDSLELD